MNWNLYVLSLRHKSGMTIKEFSSALGVSGETIRLWENGEIFFPHDKNIQRLLKFEESLKHKNE